jgi:23S rRNA pseudouridine1911/1915/1917 synthase
MNRATDYSDGGALEQPEAHGSEDNAIRVSAQSGAGDRIDRFLARMLAPVSRSRIQRWFSLGAIHVDGALVLPSRRLAGTEQIDVTPLPHEAEQSFLPDPVDFPIVHEDAHLMVVDKPAGLVVHPAAGHWRGTLMNGLLHARPDSARLPRAGIVHRLDKDTSGLMLVARSESAYERLTKMMAERRIHRSYLAVCCGEWPQPRSLDAPIGRDSRQRLRMAVVEGARGKPARTHVHPIAVSQQLSLLCCRLETGRTHQIRVHLAWAGHPLLADPLYGGRPHALIHRQALHAVALGLEHPHSGARVQYRSPVPADLQALLEAAHWDAASVSDALERLMKTAPV